MTDKKLTTQDLPSIYPSALRNGTPSQNTGSSSINKIFKLLNINPNIKLLPHLKPPEGDSPTTDPLVATQRRFCLMDLDGKICVIDKSTLNKLTEQGTLEKLKLYNRADGKLKIKRFLKEHYPDTDAKQVVEVFWESPQTTFLCGIEFNPKGTSENYLNLWEGPTIKPKSGDWDLIKFFLSKVICNGDDESYEYLIRYIAHSLQKPWEKPGVIIILKGGQGIGKGTLGRILQKIWSATYLQVNNITSVTGNFNASLERSFIVFMDEALFSGDRRSSDALKSLITEPFVLINEKHQPSRQIRSYHRFIAATNAEHFKQTDPDDRRDFTLRVSEIFKGKHSFWEDVHDEIDGEGVAAMAHDLLKMDLSDFNVRLKPNTKELLEQKLYSLDHIPRWWYECLMNGSIFEDQERWQEFVSTTKALEGIMVVPGGRMYRKPGPREVIQEMKKLCPSAIHGQKQMSGDRHRGFNLPNLKQARAEFEQYIGGIIEWPEDPWEEFS